jgi:hypothetical protein
VSWPMLMPARCLQPYTPMRLMPVRKQGTQRQFLQTVPAPLLEEVASLRPDAVAVCVLSCLPSNSSSRRGQCACTTSPQPSSPSWLLSTRCRSTQPNPEGPLIFQLLLVPADLVDEQGQLIGSQVPAVCAREAVLKLYLWAVVVCPSDSFR